MINNNHKQLATDLVKKMAQREENEDTRNPTEKDNTYNENKHISNKYIYIYYIYIRTEVGSIIIAYLYKNSS